MGATTAAQDPTRVLVIYNQNWPDRNGDGVGDSTEVALHYAARRGVPAQNLLALSCSTLEPWYYLQAGWTAFFDEVATPVLNKLQQLGEANVDVLLFCHGVPYQLTLANVVGNVVAVDDVMRSPHTLGTRTQPALPAMSTSPYYEPSPSRLPDLPRFSHAYRIGPHNFFLAARLDGASAQACKDLVEGAAYGDVYLWPQAGYYSGTAYVDTRFASYTDQQLAGYPFGYLQYADADKSMAFAKFFFTAAGYPLKWENTASDLEIGEPGARFHDGSPAQFAPDAIFYGGWYNYGRYLDVWTWLPGSCAIDLNSNSLQGIRDPSTNSFLTKAFARGLTCGTGCIGEPYLDGHPEPEGFYWFLLNGYTFAEAASLCTPTFCWVNLAVGDPLYAPHHAGKVPQIDNAPPPMPALVVRGNVDTQRTIVAAIDTMNRFPDLVLAKVEYGATRGYGSVLDFGAIHRLRHDLVLDNLTPDALYHFRVTVQDPVRNQTQTPDFVFYTRTPNPQLSGVTPPTQNAPASGPALIDLTLGHRNGALGVTGFALLLTAPHLSITDLDVTDLIWPMLADVSIGPSFELLTLKIAVPTWVLPSGTYSFKFRVQASGAPDVEDTGVVVVP